MLLKRISFKQVSDATAHTASSPCVATIGAFDGLHLGHQSILDHLKSIALKEKLLKAVITFEPLPKQFFKRNQKEGDQPIRIMRFKEKFELLKKNGIDILFVLRFDKQMADFPHVDFVEKVLISKLNVKHLVVGEDFRFGKGRKGDIHYLKSVIGKYPLDLKICPDYPDEESKISSTRIREALKKGDFIIAERLLGRKII